jgi:hypothetical protein
MPIWGNPNPQYIKKNECYTRVELSFGVDRCEAIDMCILIVDARILPT